MNGLTPFVIAVDFDGTLCEDKWPAIGRPNKELIQRLKEARQVGQKVILWTCREDQLLKDAVAWCKSYGLEFDAVNANLPERIALYKTDPRKVGADLYLDDRAENVRLEDGGYD
ncbi:MAG: hypothetical protein CVU94_00675 [Firmicutes bacterium HGW-Firmicutes-19]|nr:MAG: hypothetical protein CVU94_00675 [Firmicutes bacterium HGW-Firmicutes-19]